MAIAPNGTLTAGLAGSSPTLVQDPINPLKLAEVNVNAAGTMLQGVYSTDGGATWKTFINPITTPTPTPPNLVNLPDPNLNANPTVPNPVRYATVGAPSAAIDLNETLYITYTEQNATGTSGALVLQRFSFTTGTPTLVAGGSNQVLDQWFGADPVLNPVVGVDNNVAAFTDPTATVDNVQADTMSNKAVYIAWSTANTAPTVLPVNFNSNVIRAIASADGGKTFTTPQFVNDNGNIAALGAHYTTPKILFTQGSADGRVVGGTRSSSPSPTSETPTTTEMPRSISIPASPTAASSPMLRQARRSSPARQVLSAMRSARPAKR